MICVLLWLNAVVMGAKYQNQSISLLYQLSREDPVIMVPLRTGHLRLFRHQMMFTQFCIGHFAAPLQYITNGGGTLPAGLSDPPEAESRNLAVREKAHGPVENLQSTAVYVLTTTVPD